MKLISSVELIDSTVEDLLTKELPNEASQMNTSEHISKIKATDRTMKEAKGGESAVTMPSNEYPNGQIKKPETLNGMSQKPSPIKKILEATKSVPFDMTVKKVTIPLQWEKLGFNSSEDKIESQSNGISHDLKLNSDLKLSEDEGQRTSKESLGFDFVEDSEKFGLSDSEVDKLLEVVDKERPGSSSTESDVKEKNGLVNSENETCNEIITAPDGEGVYGNSNKSRNLDIVMVSNLDNKKQSQNVQSSSPLNDGDGLSNSAHLNSDDEILKENDIKLGDSEEEKSVMFQKSSSELDSSETVKLASDDFKHSETNPENEIMKEDKPNTIELSDNNDSSLSSSVCLENENLVVGIMSPKKVDVSHFPSCNETLPEKEPLCNKACDFDAEDDNKEVLNKKSVDLEFQSAKTAQSKMLDSVEMQCDHTEVNEKLADVEMQMDVEMKNSEIEQTDNLDDVDMQDVSMEKSIISVAQSDLTESNEQSSDKDSQVNSNLELVDTVKVDEANTNAEVTDTGDQSAQELSGKSPQITSGDSETEVYKNSNRVQVRNSNELQEIDIDSEGNSDKQIMGDEDSKSKTVVKINEQSDTVSSESEKFVVEREHAVDNAEADRVVRKRPSDLNENNDTRETKRTRVEISEHSECLSKCEKEDEKSLEKKVENETQLVRTVQCQETGENRKEIDEVDKLNNEEEKNCSTDKIDSERCKEVDKSETESCEQVKEVGEREKNVAEGDNEGNGKKICSDEQDKIDTLKGSEILHSSSKRAHEPMGLIEVKKVRISPEMEKQLKMVEGKNSSVDKSQSESEGKEECSKSIPLREPKSNLDLAIERVATGLVDLEKTDVPEPPRKLNPMPFMRDLHQNLLKKLSRNDLEEFVVQKLCEVVTDRCNLGEMRQRCQSLEQMLDQWRKKAQQLQKQLKDMEMVMKRYIGDARTRKERPIPVKITRSVGLQVQMGSMGPGMLRNRTICGEPIRTQGQTRRRLNRVSSPPVVASSTQQPQTQQQQQQQPPQQTQQQPPQQQQSLPQQQRTQPAVRTPATNPLTVQKVITPGGFTKLTTTPTAASQNSAPRAPITTLVAAAPPSVKIGPSPVKNMTSRPSTTTTTTTTITTGSTTSTINTINSTIVNTTNNLRIATASQLNNRQQPKQTTAYMPSKANPDLKIIDLTDEEDKAKTMAGMVRPINPTPTSITPSLVPSSNVTTAVTISNNPGIQAGSIRVVQPHQLNCSTTTTLLAPSVATPTTSRVTYLVPTSAGPVQQRQVFIAGSASQVRSSVMNMSTNRQNQISTLVFKNGTVVPIQQASGQSVRTAPVNTTAILRPAPPVQAGQLQQVLNPSRPGQPIRVSPSLVTTVGRMATPTIASVTPVIGNKHPAPLPNPPLYQPSNVSWKCPPPKPELKISKVSSKHQQGIVLSWNMQLTSEYEEIASYQLYAYQEGAAQPSTALWKKVGDVKALPLPMACTLTQFMEGHKYHFAVRAVDVHTRVGPFSIPGNIVLTRK